MIWIDFFTGFNDWPRLWKRAEVKKDVIDECRPTTACGTRILRDPWHPVGCIPYSSNMLFLPWTFDYMPPAFKLLPYKFYILPYTFNLGLSASFTFLPYTFYLITFHLIQFTLYLFSFYLILFTFHICRLPCTWYLLNMPLYRLPHILHLIFCALYLLTLTF